MLASYNPEEGDVRVRYLDRFACVLNTDEAFTDVSTRLEALRVAMRFQVYMYTLLYSFSADVWFAVHFKSKGTQMSSFGLDSPLFIYKLFLAFENILNDLINSLYSYYPVLHNTREFKNKKPRAFSRGWIDRAHSVSIPVQHCSNGKEKPCALFLLSRVSGVWLLWSECIYWGPELCERL